MTTDATYDRAASGIYGPVDDWATDIDHADPAYNPRAPEIWAELRERGCPVAHTDRYNGMWAPITAELVREVAYDTEHFTSRAVVVSTSTIDAESPIGGAPPISSDPPFHALARRLLLPPFAPKQIEPWEDDIRAAVPPAPRRHGRHRAGRDGRRRRDAVRRAHPGQRDRPHARLPDRGRRPVPRVRPPHARGRQPAARGARRRASGSSTTTSTCRSTSTVADPRDDLTSVPARRRAGRPEAVARPRARLDGAAAAGRHRHDVERHRLGALAPRLAPRRPPPPRRRAGADADRDRGAAAGLRPGDDGADGGARTTTSTAAR